MVNITTFSCLSIQPSDILLSSLMPNSNTCHVHLSLSFLDTFTHSSIHTILITFETGLIKLQYASNQNCIGLRFKHNKSVSVGLGRLLFTDMTVAYYTMGSITLETETKVKKILISDRVKHI